MKDLSNENIIHVKNGNIEYLQFRKLLEYKEILTHCFTLRDLDFSGYDRYEENKEKVEDSYQKVCKEFNIEYRNLCRPKQTHTDIVKVIEEGDEGIYIEKFFDVDGLVTDKKNKALIFCFADCTPLLFFDPIKKVIANVHSGWRGTLQTIGRNAVNKIIEQYSCKPEDIICCIGPTIRKCHFEVDEDVKDLFYNKFKNEIDIDKFIMCRGRSCACPKTKDRNAEGDFTNSSKYYIDTVGINKQILLNCGLKEENIIDSKICSVCDEDKIHSYRAHGDNSGRNISIMELI